MVEFVLHNLAAERIAMDAKDMRGAGLIAVDAIEHALNEALLEFSNSLVEEDAPLHHLTDQSFQLILHHVGTLQKEDASIPGVDC